MIAYKVHQDRLQAAKEEGLKTTQGQLLSVHLHHYCSGLLSKLDPERPEDLVPPLQTLKAHAVEKRAFGDAAKAEIYEATVRIVDRLPPLAEERTRTVQQVLTITTRSASTLDRKDSSATGSAFFAQNIVKRWEAGSAHRRTTVEQAMAQLRQAEATVRQRNGELAANDDFAPRKRGQTYVEVGGTVNPLDRGSYDQRRGPSIRDQQMSGDSGSLGR
jgi:hypothetical protein